jgi:hypothetical protein
MTSALARRTIRNEGRAMRLSLVAVLAAAGFALYCGGAGAGRLWMPKADNPYCDVATYTLRDVPEQAMSMNDLKGKPVIVVSGYALADKPAYGRFLLAHECCHHSLGHVARFSKRLGQVGPQPFFYLAPALKQMELDADCCAIKMLRARHDSDSINSAEEEMRVFGSAPTGAYYPTGTERADNMAACAASD